MRWLIYIIAVAMAACSNSAVKSPENTDSSYNAITDTSKVTQDSLAVPDSATPTVTH